MQAGSNLTTKKRPPISLLQAGPPRDPRRQVAGETALVSVGFINQDEQFAQAR